MNNKTIIITGVSRGIGKATLEKFLENGDFVIGTSTSGRFDSDKQNFRGVKLDLANQESIEEAVREIKKILEDKNSKIDILINNAGMLFDWDEEELNIEGLRKTLEVNLIGTADFTEKLLPLIADGGHIINLSSQMSSLTFPLDSSVPSYRISKVALNMYTRTLAERLRDRSIIVSAIDPGWVKTDMGRKEAPKQSEEPAQEIFELANRQVESGQFWREGKKRPW